MIHLSAAAANEISRLRSRHKLPNLLFRLGIQPSNCLPLAYTMDFDDTIQPDDQVYESEGVQIVVSQKTLPYMDGLVLDYSEDLMGGGFRFHNPNAVQNCGCGNSFAVATHDSEGVRSGDS
jgi:iron-sulfur cluster assembly accessory protein